MFPGDFKWNIFFEEWIWHQDADSLELDIEIKGNNDALINAGSNVTYDLGGDTTLELRSDYEIFGDVNSFVNMPDGYPLVSQKAGKTLFTFKFQNDGTSFKYDPIITFDSSEETSATASLGLKLATSVMLTVAGMTVIVL